MYKWADEAGNVTYSNTPPTDRAKVKDVTKIDDINTVPLDKRPKERHTAGTIEPSAAKSNTPAAKVEGVTVRSEPARAGEPAAREPEIVRFDPAPRASNRPPQPEAVQDPCLRSADPHCYQRNRDKYHPFMGYAPSAAPGAFGASTSPAGIGAIGGQVGPAPAADRRPAPVTPAAPAITVKTK
jgi:hypothetical protein